MIYRSTGSWELERERARAREMETELYMPYGMVFSYLLRPSLLPPLFLAVVFPHIRLGSPWPVNIV